MVHSFTAFIYDGGKEQECYRNISQPDQEEEKVWPGDERDVWLNVSHGRLTLSHSWFLIFDPPEVVRSSSAPRNTADSCEFLRQSQTNGDMNGSTNPLLDKEEHVLKLGESFEKRPKSSFHTIRCECQQTKRKKWRRRR